MCLAKKLKDVDERLEEEFGHLDFNSDDLHINIEHFIRCDFFY